MELFSSHCVILVWWVELFSTLSLRNPDKFFTKLNFNYPGFPKSHFSNPNIQNPSNMHKWFYEMLFISKIIKIILPKPFIQKAFRRLRRRWLLPAQGVMAECAGELRWVRRKKNWLRRNDSSAAYKMFNGCLQNSKRLPTKFSTAGQPMIADCAEKKIMWAGKRCRLRRERLTAAQM